MKFKAMQYPVLVSPTCVPELNSIEVCVMWQQYRVAVQGRGGVSDSGLYVGGGGGRRRHRVAVLIRYTSLHLAH